jgi:hypothetical protein
MDSDKKVFLNSIAAKLAVLARRHHRCNGRYRLSPDRSCAKRQFNHYLSGKWRDGQRHWLRS